MARINGVLAIIIWVAGCLALAAQADSLYWFVFFIPFSLGPHAVTHFLCLRLKSRGATNLLGIGMLVYAAWFSFLYTDAFYFNIDALSALALVMAGVASLPVMVPLWITAAYLDASSKLKAEMQAGGTEPSVGEIGSEAETT